jgi:hypothetical protein
VGTRERYTERDREREGENPLQTQLKGYMIGERKREWRMGDRGKLGEVGVKGWEVEARWRWQRGDVCFSTAYITISPQFLSSLARVSRVSRI